MTTYISQSLDQLAQEVEFWRDFIQWWEEKNGRRAGKRVQAALSAAEGRHRDAVERQRRGLCED